MIYFSKVGTNENIGYETMPKEIPLGYIQMDKERPTIEHIAQEGGVWLLPVKTLEIAKANQLDKINDEVSKEIIGGFTVLVSEAITETGEVIKNKNIVFDSTEYDQANFIQKQMFYSLQEPKPDFLVVRGLIEGDAHKKAMRVNIEVYNEILKTFGEHKENILKKGWLLKTKILSTKTTAEAEKIIW